MTTNEIRAEIRHLEQCDGRDGDCAAIYEEVSRLKGLLPEEIETYEPDTGPILLGMELFDKWAQNKSNTVILDAMYYLGFEAYLALDADAILSPRGYVLVESGPQLHIQSFLDHKVIWGGNGMVAISPSQTIIPATHTI